jgi:Ca2+-binding RTX toxin-like protein
VAAQPCTQTGDDGDNHLVGTIGPDVLCGMGGNDLLEGLDGDDVLEGGDGVDAATWESFPCCIRADLAIGTASGQGTDRLVEIENFFRTYKELERRTTEVHGWHGVDQAWLIIEAAMAARAKPESGEALAKPGTWR